MHPQLSNGVMVAQQVLVLFVVVRIRLGQHKSRVGITSSAALLFLPLSKIFHIFMYE